MPKAPPLLDPFKKPASEPNPPTSALLVYNPAGGKKRAAKLADTIVLPLLKQAGIAVTVETTKHAGHGVELGRTLDLSSVDALLVMGGDGTLGEVLDGFLSRDDGAAARTTVGFIPAGTGNSYMREVLGVPASGAAVGAAVHAAVEAIVGGRSRAVDCQQLDMTGLDGKPLRRCSINTVMAGFGPDANAVAERRRWLGSMRYSVSIKTEILKLPWRKKLPCSLSVDGGSPQEMEDLFLFSCFVNKHTGVRHRLAPYAQLDDGLLDLAYTTRPLRSIATAAKVDEMIKSGGKHVHATSLLNVQQASRVRLETDTPARLMVDGDIIGFTPLDVAVRAEAFRLFTPASPAPS